MVGPGITSRIAEAATKASQSSIDKGTYLLRNEVSALSGRCKPRSGDVGPRDPPRIVARDDLVVRRPTIVGEHHLLHIIGNDGRLDIGAGEGLDCSERVPQGDDLELRPSLDVAPEDRRPDETGERGELRKCFVFEMADVAVGEITPGDAFPMPRDH